MKSSAGNDGDSVEMKGRAMRTMGALIGGLLGVCAIDAMVAFIGFDDLARLPFYQEVVFSMAAVFAMFLFVTLGVMLVSITGKSRLLDSRQNEPSETSGWISFGVHSAKWGWIFGLCAILLSVLSAMSVATSFTMVPLIVAFPLFLLGGACAFIALITIFFKPTMPLGLHVTAGVIVKFSGRSS